MTVLRLEPGEPAAGPWSAVPLGELVQRLHAAAGTPAGRPRVVAVDGRGGAGKSTLVDLLQAQVPCSAVVHTDDVAWHHAFFDWADVLAEHVLHPLHRGEAVDHARRRRQSGPPGRADRPRRRRSTGHQRQLTPHRRRTTPGGHGSWRRCPAQPGS